MSKCQFCSTEVSQFTKPLAYLVGTISQKNDKETETHIHGHIEDKTAMKEIIETAIQEAGLTEFYNKKGLNNLENVKEVVFHNRQRIGDMFMFTCAIRDFKKAFPHVKVGVCSTAMHIWDNNPYLDYTVKPDDYESIMNDMTIGKVIEKDSKGTILVKEVEPGKLFVRIGPSSLTNASNRLDWHFANAYRVSMEERLKVSIQQGESRGDIWFSQEEYDAPRVTEKPYWIIVTGGEKGWGTKMYPTVRWQEVIDQNPDILFYQVGAAGDNHVRLKGPNVVDWIGKTEDRNTGLRDLLKLFLNAEGSIGLVSFHMHLMGALKKPSVVIAGAREPVSFTRYAGHQYIANDGCLPCAETTACWHCDMYTCTNLVDYSGNPTKLTKEATQAEKDAVMPKCVDIIKSEEVTRYLRRYYDGGRLKIGVVSKKSKVQIAKDAKIMAPVAKANNPNISDAPTNPTINTYGLEFNGGALTQRDWEFICDAIKKYKVKSVLEFGAGLSTLLLNDKVERVVTYEDKQGWIDKLKKLQPKSLIYLWDGKNFKDEGEVFDLAFVDGPSGDASREEATKIGASSAKVVIVHDAGREWAKKYQEQYIAPYFDGPIRGGHRCHLWIKKTSNETTNVPKKEEAPIASNIVDISKRELTVDSKFIKFVSTARGYGGCARSIVTIMDFLIKEGHKVEFIPFRNSVGSRELKEIFKTKLKDVIVTENYDTIKEDCDVFFMYGDDYIWEFKQPDVIETFSNISAKKKIMMLNYRRGPVGQVEWTKGWDKYMFLNSIQEKELLKLIPDAKTKVLPPCAILDDFFGYVPDYTNGVRIVRHSSQGDTKFISEHDPVITGDYTKEMATKLITDALASRPDVSIAMLPGPSFINPMDRFTKFPRTDKPDVIADFLSKGNLFWYSLPPGYPDMGPRVIIEAMALGLPIIADNWGGAVDRVTPETGWLCNSKEEMLEIIKNVTPEELEKKGQAAKQRAMDEFVPYRYVAEIVEND
jgi:ADP-heptose:LPS heptosyltransferase/glycosyltransferase involved in cell wall biosynthesis